MSRGTLTIDLDAIARNWRALDRLSQGKAAAVIKADAYGLGAARVGPALARAGARTFFVAIAEEGAALRAALGEGPEIAVFAGHMAGDAALIRDHALIPLLNSPAQIARHDRDLPGHPFGLQLDSGMSRLGIAPADWDPTRAMGACLVMSHLACADDPAHHQNATQIDTFTALTADIAAPRSLAATGGILMGEPCRFDLTRPGVGLYGGLPFDKAEPVATLSLPVIQTRTVPPGTAVGYGAAWTAPREARIATVSAGYADGLIRAMGDRARLWHGDTPVPLAGRVSMDLLTVDITDLPDDPETLDILGPHQTVDDLATAAGTIGYEILTALGPRYERVYKDG